MGVVYKAQDLDLDRFVALKFLPPDLTRDEESQGRFIHEAKAASALDHPNICNIHEIGTTNDGQVFIVMAHYTGETLEQKIGQGSLCIEEAVTIANKVAQGLERAHKKGIIHRDIKPANIINTCDGEVKILDFGLAKLSGQTKLTKNGTTLGTVAYMSPEQATGEGVDHRSDIWSLGVVLYEMITGEVPFKGDYEQAVIYSILNEEPASLEGLNRDIPSELIYIINKALSKSPDERYMHMDKMKAGLETVRKSFETGTDRRPVSLLKNLLERRVPHILFLYGVSCIGLLLVLQWVVNRFLISPHLPSFGFIAMFSMLPTVLLLAYFHGQPGRNRWRRQEKIGIPANMLATALLLFALFHGKDLGSTTKTVTLIDENDQVIERVIPKSEFRKRIACFFFKNDSPDSTLNTLQYGILYALNGDLGQDLFISLTPPYEYIDKMKMAGFPEGIGLPLMLKRKIAQEHHQDYFISGSINKINDELTLVSSLYETRRGKLLNERTFTGIDFFQLIDEMSAQLKIDLGLASHYLEETPDLPVSELSTNSFSAFKSYTIGSYLIEYRNEWMESISYFKQAVKEDPTFAWAWWNLAGVYGLTNQSEKGEGAREAMIQHIYKIPENGRYFAKYAYRVYRGELGKAFRNIENQVDLFPDDMKGHEYLAYMYLSRNQKDEAISEYKKIFESDPSQLNNLKEIVNLFIEKEHNEEALKYCNKYADQFPDDSNFFTILGELYEMVGHHKQARSYFEKALLAEPGNMVVMLNLAEHESKNGKFDEAAAQYQEALEVCGSPKDRYEIYNALKSLYNVRGQLNKAIGYMHLARAESENFLPPSTVLLSRLSNIKIYFKAEQIGHAFSVLDSIKASLDPLLAEFMHFGYLFAYLELEDLDNLQKTLETFEEFIESSGYERNWAYAYYARAKMHELKGEFEYAIENYQKVPEFRRNVISYEVDIGRCYRKLGQFDEAKETLQKILKAEPYNPETLYEIALVYWEMGQKAKALEYLNKALYVWEEADPVYKPAKKAKDELIAWKVED